MRSYQHAEGGVIPHQPNREAIARALGVPTNALFVDPSLLSRKASPTVDSLARIIEDQERRIFELESLAKNDDEKSEILSVLSALDDGQVARYLTMMKTELSAASASSRAPKSHKKTKKPGQK